MIKVMMKAPKGHGLVDISERGRQMKEETQRSRRPEPRSWKLRIVAERMMNISREDPIALHLCEADPIPRHVRKRDSREAIPEDMGTMVSSEGRAMERPVEVRNNDTQMTLRRKLFRGAPTLQWWNGRHSRGRGSLRRCYYFSIFLLVFLPTKCRRLSESPYCSRTW